MPGDVRDQPSILHVDMDAFFASVEILEHPELQGHPVIVGGSGGRGVVASCNYEARRYGIRSAMPSAHAKRLCPHAKFVDGNYARYEHYSQRLMALLNEFTPLVEPVSIDEAFMDVAGARRLWGSPGEVAKAVRHKVWVDLSLRATVGGANTKHLAKLASVHAKPRVVDGELHEGDGYLVVPTEESLQFLRGLSVRKLWGVGPKTADRLEASGFRMVAQLADADFDALKGVVGNASAHHLMALATNADSRSVEVHHSAKSMGHEQTFSSDLTSRSEIEACLLRQSDAVASRIRADSKMARTVNLKVRFGDFRTITRAFTLPEATTSGGEIFKAVKALLAQVDLERGVRLVGVSASNLVDHEEEVAQMTLDLKESNISADVAKVDEVVDDIRKRFGKAAVMPATLAGNKGRGVLDRGERQWGPTAEDENRQR